MGVCGVQIPQSMRSGCRRGLMRRFGPDSGVFQEGSLGEEAGEAAASWNSLPTRCCSCSLEFWPCELFVLA